MLLLNYAQGLWEFWLIPYIFKNNCFKGFLSLRQGNVFFDFCKARNEEKHQKICVFYEDKSKFGALKSSTTKLFFEVKGKYCVCKKKKN